MKCQISVEKRHKNGQNGTYQHISFLLFGKLLTEL